MNMFSSPIGRLSFLARYILSVVPLAVGGVLLSFGNQSHNVFLLLLSLVFEVLGFVYIIGFTLFPRLVSVGLSKWFAFLLFVPFLNFLFVLFLLFCPAGKFVKE